MLRALPVALTLATLAAPVRAADAPMPPVAELRRGVHAGVAIGPGAMVLLASGEPKFGVTANLFVHWGISPRIELRAGIKGDAAGSQVSYMGLGAPLSLRVNLGGTYAIALGAFGGMMTDTTHVAFVAGPEWSMLSFRFGERRQLEIELAQGIHFHVAPPGGGPNLGRFQSSLVLTYVALDAPH